MAQSSTSLCSPATPLSVVESFGVWDVPRAEKPEERVFITSLVILTDGRDYYYIHHPSRDLPEDMALLAAQAILIPRNYYQALPPSGVQWQIAPDSLPDDTYLKVPSFLIGREPETAFDPPTPAEGLVREALILHELAKSPHPNIVVFRGLYVRDGLMTGLCLKKYDKTLNQCVKDHDELDVSSVIDGIESGLKHLHSLGFVHGDINPSNIVFGATNLLTPVIIDFDSCLREGEKIVARGGTLGWCIEDGPGSTAKVAYDDFGLNAIRSWLDREYA